MVCAVQAVRHVLEVTVNGHERLHARPRQEVIPARSEKREVGEKGRFPRALHPFDPASLNPN